MKTNKTITIEGTRYTAKKLRKLASEKGVELNGGDIAIKLPGNAEIAIHDYGDDQGVGVLNFGIVRRRDGVFGTVAAFVA